MTVAADRLRTLAATAEDRPQPLRTEYVELALLCADMADELCLMFPECADEYHPAQADVCTTCALLARLSALSDIQEPA